MINGSRKEIEPVVEPTDCYFLRYNSRIAEQTTPCGAFAGHVCPQADIDRGIHAGTAFFWPDGGEPHCRKRHQREPTDSSAQISLLRSRFVISINGEIKERNRQAWQKQEKVVTQQETKTECQQDKTEPQPPSVSPQTE